jgi:hypothetical protein
MKKRANERALRRLEATNKELEIQNAEFRMFSDIIAATTKRRV